ncbi:MAG: hypothetical protein ABIH23_12145 [bacterium]
MSAIPAGKKTSTLIRQYIAKHGVPPGLDLIESELDDLTEEEQRELIEDCEAMREGHEKGTKPLRQFMAENGL